MSDQIKIKVNLDGQETLLTLNQINKEIENLSEQAAGLDQTSEEFKAVTDQINALKLALEQGLTINVDNEEAITKIDETQVAADTLNNTSVDITVEANTQNATTNIQNLDSSLEGIKSDTEIKLDVNTDKEKINELVNALKEGKDAADVLDNTEIKPEVSPEPAQNITNTTNSVAGLRKELLQLTAEFENTQFGTDKYNELEQKIGDVSVKLAQAKDRSEDLTDALKLQVGSGVERANNSFKLLAEGIKNLDFQKVGTSLKGLGGIIKDSFSGPFKDLIDGFKQIGGSIKNLDFGGLKGGLSGVTQGFGALGKAIISTGIGALVVGVGMLIANFDSLKESGGVVGKIFTTIGDAVQGLVDRFRPLLSALGLVASESDLKAEKVKEANDIEKEAIAKRYDREIELAKAAGKETTEIEKAKVKALKESADSEIALLNEIQQKQGQLNKEQKERLKELTDQSQELAFQAQLIETTAAKERSDKQKEEDDKAKARREKQLEEQKKYIETIKNLEDKYIEDNIKNIENQYQKELDLIKGNSIQEEALRERIRAKRDFEIAKANEKLITDQRNLNNQIELLRLENQTKEIEANAATQEEIFEIQKSYEKELLDLKLSQLEEQYQAEITAVGVTADQKILIEQEYINDKNKLNEDYSKKQEERVNKETTLVINSTQEQADAIKKEREDIVNDSIQGIGIFGRLDLLDQNLKKELDLLEKQKNELKKIQQQIIDDSKTSDEAKQKAREEQLKLEEDFQKKSNQITQEGADIRAQIIAEEVQTRISQASELSNVAFNLVSTNLQSQQDALDQEGQLLEQQYNQRREKIEKNIIDEEARAQALTQLDNETQAAREKLEKRNLELKKKQIKNERNQSLVNILLATADSIAKATAAADKTNPISFAISLAANIAAALAAIKKAKDALKQADSAAGPIGGGGETSPSDVSYSPPNTQSNATTPLVPTTGVASGINPQDQNIPSTGQQIIRPVVSVIDIEARLNSNRTSVSEATISSN